MEIKGKLIQGPWGQRKPEIIFRQFSSGGYKTIDYFAAIERQENAFKSGMFMLLYVINNDYNRTFLIPGAKEDVEYQIHTRKQNPQEIEKIKQSLNSYF